MHKSLRSAIGCYLEASWPNFEAAIDELTDLELDLLIDALDEYQEISLKNYASGKIVFDDDDYIKIWV